MSRMTRLTTASHPNLRTAELPGPDTQTKREAILTHDPRMKLMLAEAARVGWPAAYTDDLYRHDRDQLARHPSQTLLWILRDHGTHLYPTLCENSHEATYYRQVIAYWSGEHKLNYSPHAEGRARYYLVSAEELREVSWQQAQEAVKYHTPDTDKHVPHEGFAFD